MRWSAEQLRIHGLDESGAPATFADFLARVHPDDRAGRGRRLRAPSSAPATWTPRLPRGPRATGRCAGCTRRRSSSADPDGGPPRLIGTSRDVTEHHLAEAALRERERTLDEVEELAGLGTWEWHLPTDTITWSREQRRIHGLPDDAGTQTFAEFLAARAPRRPRAGGGRVRRGCIATRIPFSFPYRVVRPDGSVREMHALGKLLPDPAGTGERMVGISQDVTERNAADRALRATRGPLSRPLRAVSPQRQGVRAATAAWCA